MLSIKSFGFVCVLLMGATASAFTVRSKSRSLAPALWANPREFDGGLNSRGGDEKDFIASDLQAADEHQLTTREQQLAQQIEEKQKDVKENIERGLRYEQQCS